jgi:hypothetical protein
VAVGYDVKGNEIARATQTVNLPRPTAEFVIALQNEKDGSLSAELRWEHLLASKPAKSSLTVDGQPVALDHNNRARLPHLDMERGHVIAAEIRFEDGFVTRREIVVGGPVSYTADLELTAVAVHESSATPPANLGDCFTSTGSPVRVAAVEKSPPLVVIVLDPDQRDALQALNPNNSNGALSNDRTNIHHRIALDAGTRIRVLRPVARRSSTTSNTAALLFPPSRDVDASEAGLVWLFTHFYEDKTDEITPRQTTDAVGVAGLAAITGAHRRAVVLVLSRYKDTSVHRAAAIRNYLSNVGVPLFVWSLTGPRPELQNAWGDIDDISTPQKLKTAADRLRAELASQRVAWVAADPVTALHVIPTGKCGITPLASLTTR